MIEEFKKTIAKILYKGYVHGLSGDSEEIVESAVDVLDFISSPRDLPDGSGEIPDFEEWWNKEEA